MRIFWGVLLTVLSLASCKHGKESALEENDLIDQTSEQLQEPRMEFGFNLEDFHVQLDTVKAGDSFGEIMMENHVDYPKIARVSHDFKDTFDVRKIKVGKPYIILKSKDTSQVAQVFIYQNDPIHYTVVDLRDSVVAYKEKRSVTKVVREVSGVIETSLSEAILQQGIDYNVTNELSEIYAWTVDFFRLQKGDRFKVIYEEKYINDSIYAGAGNIQAAYFENNGRPLYAFAYAADSISGKMDYFDDQANNLKRAFLKAPVQFSRISSRYNLKRRIAFYGNKIRPHKGTDYAAPVGTPILATADGTVVESTRKGGNGKYVKIRHNGTYSTQYLHMKSQKVRKGDFVRQGDVIGWVGMTGNTSGPHVCYRFWKNGHQVDPLKEELPRSEPLAEELRADYYTYIQPLKSRLDCIEYPNTELEEDFLTLNE